MNFNNGSIPYNEGSGDEHSMCELDSRNVSSEDEINLNNHPEPQASTSESRSQEDDEYIFDVLSADELVEFMLAEINQVNEIMKLPTTMVRILLNHFNWDKAKLLERFYDTDQEQLFREAHVVSPFITNKATGQPQLGGVEQCEICLTEQPSSAMSGLACGHRFCSDCWSGYLTTRVMEDGVGCTISCAAHGCDILVDDETVLRLVTEPRVLARYQRLITDTFVQCNRRLCWCPSPDCGRAVRVAYPDARPVLCGCGHRFCFACGDLWHEPVRCHLLKRWRKKCDDDSETFNWLSANTKECPKCKVTIEKDGGCNHMICKNQSCRADFCWVCLGPWEPHGSSWYSCNRFDEAEARAARDAQELSRAALNRYLFYFNRFINHSQSLRFESRLYASVQQKMEEMQQHNMSWIEVQFLKKAVDVLCSCRQTLMYTYVFAYYLQKNNQSTIFEENQKDLERCTELLSEYLERDITQQLLADIKQTVQDKYRYCESRRKVLLGHVLEGYERDWWVYSE
ncbi:E3 ubiquitin-protein ligase ariadne-1-like isoform X2 [Amphibalanus amphitrite]|uniref:E3 ubiquitin-protein ligase ariadne-1-like isoform X2 n=2 Tax=Amphibalanus amphitrite TaxID=1232801 RepID=UPI001C91FEE1|nr:E3 ubiquitin-protein ligase ariadne-1-like isoform X2 [Amphibalanus amphitrite]